LIGFIASLPEIATAPDMTALWHEQQQQIEQGSLTVDQFLDGLESFISNQVGAVNLGAMAEGEKTSANQSANRLQAECPKCGGEIAVTPKVFACTGCDIKLWGEIAGKKISQAQAETLFAKGQTAEIKGFTSKAGKPFSAKLVLNQDSGKVGFAFDQSKRK
jgi:DNA topoisomerase-3